MFGNNKKTTDSSGTAKSSNSISNAVNSLVTGTKVEGKISTDNDIRIDGSLEGQLDCKSKLIIGQDGRIEGEVNCQNAVIEGHFIGKLLVNDLLHLKETAVIDGEVKTGQLIVDSGGVINGNCEMGGMKVKNIANLENVNSKVGS